MTSHLFVPDTQVGPDTPTQHLAWAGQYIVDRHPDVVVHAGDHWDMPSLNSHRGRGSLQLEGQRYVADVEAGNTALELLRAPARRAKLKTEFHLLRGNHEERIVRAVDDDPKLEGVLSLSDLKSPGWTVHDFLVPVWLDGIAYSHYFYQPMTGRPFGGTIDNRLRQIGHSFSQGHQQTLLHAQRYVAGRSQHGLVAGAFYLHEEAYRGPQATAHWRGLVVKHQVSRGSYDIMTVSMDYLCQRYEGMSLDRFKRLNKIRGW